MATRIRAQSPTTSVGTKVPNGAAVAAFLAAGVGSFAMGVFVLLNELGLWIAPALYGPAGGVSGRTTLAALIWAAAWLLLHRLWRERELAPGPAYAATLLLIALGVLGTFPPFWAILG